MKKEKENETKTNTLQPRGGSRDVRVRNYFHPSTAKEFSFEQD